MLDNEINDINIKSQKLIFLENEKEVDITKYRLIIFLSIAFTLIILEFFFSFRKRVSKRAIRWPANIMIILIDSLLLKMIIPTGLFGVALWAKNNDVGLLNYLEINNVYSAILTFILLDLAIYFQHYYSHKWPLLWRFHKVHHTDPDLDFTSALRFHPFEILYSLVFKIGLVLILGANALSVLVFEIVLNSMSMFNHANIHIPHKIEKILRLIFVTPQMHIIHHSVVQRESDSNYSFNFSLWDHVFNTYTSRFKSDGTIGQIGYFETNKQKIIYLMRQPFLSRNDGD